MTRRQIVARVDWDDDLVRDSESRLGLTWPPDEFAIIQMATKRDRFLDNPCARTNFGLKGSLSVFMSR